MIIKKYRRSIFFLLIVHLTEDFHTLYKSVDRTIHAKKNAHKDDPDTKIKHSLQPYRSDNKTCQRERHRQSQLGQPYKHTQFFQSNQLLFAFWNQLYTKKRFPTIVSWRNPVTFKQHFMEKPPRINRSGLIFWKINYLLVIKSRQSFAVLFKSSILMHSSVVCTFVIPTPRTTPLTPLRAITLRSDPPPPLAV